MEPVKWNRMSQKEKDDFLDDRLDDLNEVFFDAMRLGCTDVKGLTERFKLYLDDPHVVPFLKTCRKEYVPK